MKAADAALLKARKSLTGLSVDRAARLYEEASRVASAAGLHADSRALWSRRNDLAVLRTHPIGLETREDVRQKSLLSFRRRMALGVHR